MKRTLFVAFAMLLISLSLRAQKPSIAEKDVTVLSFKLHYREAGHGAPVILLHGLGGDGSRWGPNIGPLATTFHVIALDQIGFGQSDKPLANYHIGMLSEFLVDFMKAVGTPRASLVGNSMGAQVAEYTAVHYPSAVDRIVLIDGAGYMRSPDTPAVDPHLRQIQNGVTRDETREFMRILFHDKSLVTDQVVDDNFMLRLRSAFAISKIQESFDRSVGGITQSEMQTIKAPTLIVWGRYDELAGPPERGGERLHRDIAGSRLIVIDNAGHMPQLERPDDVNGLLKEFLSTQTSRNQ
jgi:2-hydroxy-6-oxonona-2,4-dienedioate hydrolase